MLNICRTEKIKLFWSTSTPVEDKLIIQISTTSGWMLLFFIYINSCWCLKSVQRRTNIAIDFWRWVLGCVLFCNSLGGTQTNSAWRWTSRGERDTPVLCMFTSGVLVEVTQWLACLPAGLVVMDLVLHWGRFENLIWAPRSIQAKLGIRKIHGKWRPPHCWLTYRNMSASTIYLPCEKACKESLTFLKFYYWFTH